MKNLINVKQLLLKEDIIQCTRNLMLTETSTAKEKWVHKKLWFFLRQFKPIYTVVQFFVLQYKDLLCWVRPKRKGVTLREKCPIWSFFLVGIFLYLDWIHEKTNPNNFRISKLFTQCYLYSMSGSLKNGYLFPKGGQNIVLIFNNLEVSTF